MNKEKLYYSSENLVTMLANLTATARESKTIEEYEPVLKIIDSTLSCIKKLQELGVITIEGDDLIGS